MFGTGRLFRFSIAVLAAGLLSGGAYAKITTVVIDAGHGGKDKGAFWGGVRESHLTLQVAQRTEALLKRRGMRTVMTRRSDVFVSLPSRVATANRQKNAVFVSIHFNACTDSRFRGVETFYWGPTGKSFATQVQKRLVQQTKTLNRGVKRKGYRVLLQTRCPAILVECGFISHPGERARCRTAAYQQAVAQAICDGVMAAR